jgi:hypothetical protein
LDSLEIANNTLFIDGDSAPRRLMSGALRDILDPVIGVFWPKGRGDITEIRSSHASICSRRRRLYVRVGTFDLTQPQWGPAA